MNLSISIDMNLTARWVPFFEGAGYAAVHWSTVGPPWEIDSNILAWALANEFMIFTHDLDFGTALAMTHAPGPSVLQGRTRGAQPERVGPLVLRVLRLFDAELSAGALIVVDERKPRIRVLPF